MTRRRRNLTLMKRKREHERNRHCGPSLQGSLRIHCLMQRLWTGQGDVDSKVGFGRDGGGGEDGGQAW